MLPPKRAGNPAKRVSESNGTLFYATNISVKYCY